MFRPDIDVIRAVHSDRIRRDVVARSRPEIAARDPWIVVVRRSIGRSIVRVGARVAGERAGEQSLDLARSR